MMIVRRSALVAVLALAVTAAAAAATASPWARRADAVCVVWSARAKAALGTKPPKTAAAAYQFSVKAIRLEREELAALRKIPGVTPAGRRALHSVDVDLAEIEVGVHAWRAGDKVRFVRVYDRWQSDFRPHRAFVAAGAKKCG